MRHRLQEIHAAQLRHRPARHSCSHQRWRSGGLDVHFFVDRSEMDVAQYIQALQNYININVPAVQAKHEQLKMLPIVIGEVRNLLLTVSHRSHH